mgnify:CR=1 FL=1
MFNWKLTVVISSVPILLSSRELLEIPYSMAPVFSSSRSVALVSPLFTSPVETRRKFLFSQDRLSDNPDNRMFLPGTRLSR